MIDNPLVSILCLCYNQEKFILESLESIKAQTYTNFEVLICDDFSKDNSVNVIESWILQNINIKTILIKHSENKGITKSLNELLKLSKGKYIQILALDDILVENKLERHIKILEDSSDDEALVFSDAHLIDDQSNLYQNKFIAKNLSYLSLHSQNFYQMLLEGNFIPAMSALIKKETIVAENGWDESLSFEDYDMWLRLSKKYTFLFDDHISCSYRLHNENSFKKKTVINNAAIFKILIKHTENKQIRQKVFMHLEKIYRDKSLKDEHIIFFDHYKIQSFPERVIKNNYNPKLYRLALEIERFLKLLRLY